MPCPIRFLVLLTLAIWLPAHWGISNDSASAVVTFVQTHCVDCHNSDSAEGNLDLMSLTEVDIEQADESAFLRWVQVHDRVRAGEMPPESDMRHEVSGAFCDTLATELTRVDRARASGQGRAIWRRMNRHEYENTLRDLLDAPWLQIKQNLPEDGEAYRFNKVGEALDTSHVQISRYVQAADSALRQVMVTEADQPSMETRRYYARQQPALARRLRYNPFNRSPERAVFPLLDHEADLEVLEDESAPASLADSDPDRLERESFGVVASSYEPLELRFDQFKAPASGRYRLRFSAYTFWAGPGTDKRWWRPDRATASKGRRHEPVTIYAQAPPRLLRWLGGFDVYPQPSVQELEVELLAGETIRPDAARLFRSRPPGWHNPLAERDGMPGVAFRWMEVDGPIHDTWPPAGHQLLFGDLPMGSGAEPGQTAVITNDPTGDAQRLMRTFLARAYRRPVDESDVERFTSVVSHALDTGSPFSEAMLAGYTAVLCSPEFVCFYESPGPLDDHALATRLSYFLLNSQPDASLRTLADAGQLADADTLGEQVDRLIESDASRRFVDAFLDYWLDLRRADETSADEFLYNDYYLDDLLVESAVEETRRFFHDLLLHNRPARDVVDSDDVFVNERLARHYGLEGVEGIQLRRVSLPEDSPRGGLLTQASVLKVTADGTNTSPVRRGAWVMERILGQKPPPPPPTVPGLEPDIRGAETIREQLEKHRSTDSCNQCHQKIDPPGFAMENFDVLGGWRDQYRTLAEDIGKPVEGYGKNGQPLRYRLAQGVDASGELPSGQRFDDIHDLKRLLLEDERQIARNLVQQLLIYATGAPLRFGDREEIERILDAAQAEEYGVRTIVREIVTSELFGNK